MTSSRLRSLSQACQEAQESGDESKQAQAHAKLGKYFLSRNNYREASQHYQKSSQIYTELCMNRHLIRVLNHLGVCKTMLGHPGEAIEDLQRALNLQEEGEPNKHLQSAILGNLGLAYSRLSDYTKALKYHRSAFDLSEELQDPQLQLQAQINLADVLLHAGHADQAHNTALKALALAEEIDAKRSMISTLDLLGMISTRQGDLRTAIDYHAQAAQAAEEQGDLHRQGIALANKALALEGLTELQEAQKTMQKAQEIFTTLQSNYRKKTQQDLQRIKKGLEKR
ncbi:MAG: tetratricopeptide repeat protein [Anaerolineales bacterium]